MPTSRRGRIDGGVPTGCDAEEVDNRHLRFHCLFEPPIVGGTRVTPHEGVVNQLLTGMNLLVDPPLIVIPNSRAGPWIDGADAQYKTHRARLEDTTLRINERNSLTAKQKPCRQIFRLERPAGSAPF